MTNVCIIVGARPNFVKVAPLVRVLGATSDADSMLVYAGRDDDPTLEPTLFSDLDMPAPQVYLGCDSQRLNEITSFVMGAFDSHLDRHPADVIVVVDDLASTMAAAIVAKKRGLRLAHLVAGTRTFDPHEPKEVNRLVIDALSDYLFTAGVRSNSVATREQAEGSNTYMVGNILLDTLRFNHQRFVKPPFHVNEQEYIVFTINRKALLADEAKLALLLAAMSRGANGTPIIAPLRGLAADVVSKLATSVGASITCQAALPYLQFGWLTAHARGIITDSGNVAEEATFNGVPCITLNSYTEHQETVSVGTNVLVGEEPQLLEEETRKMVAGNWKKCALPDRWDGRTAERIVQILVND